MNITCEELTDINNALMELEALQLTPAQRDSLNTAINTIAAVTSRANIKLLSEPIQETMPDLTKIPARIRAADHQLAQEQEDLIAFQRENDSDPLVGRRHEDCPEANGGACEDCWPVVESRHH
jgi:hypothetical protein